MVRVRVVHCTALIFCSQYHTIHVIYILTMSFLHPQHIQLYNNHIRTSLPTVLCYLLHSCTRTGDTVTAVRILDTAVTLTSADSLKNVMFSLVSHGFLCQSLALLNHQVCVCVYVRVYVCVSVHVWSMGVYV